MSGLQQRGPATPQELEQQRRRAIYDQTHHVSSIDKLPADVRYWGIKNESYRYDTGYGERGQPDYSTAEYLSVTWFETEEALEAWVLERVEAREKYRIFRAHPIQTEVKAVFSFKD